MRYRFAVLDDELAISICIKENLHKICDCDVCCFRTVEPFIDHVARIRPDCLFVDVLIGAKASGLNALAALQAVWNVEGVPHIPSVVISQIRDIEMMRLADRLGVIDCISKDRAIMGSGLSRVLRLLLNLEMRKLAS